MHYRQLGRTGLKVSELCLGTMTFGSNFFNIAQVGQEEATRMVARVLEVGVNFFDTADMYSYGESEEILGKALKSLGVDRHAVVIATKVRSPMTQAAMDGSGDPNNVGLSRQHIMAAVEASLRRLDTDHIDLYQVHGWDRLAPMEETLRALDDLVRQGKVHYLGCSNWAARHLAKALAWSDARSQERFVSLQAYYSLAGRDLEHELLPLAAEEGLGVLPWSPLAGGFLGGRIRRDQALPGDTRRAGFDFPPVDLERGYDAIDALETVARELEATIPQVALTWLLTRPAVSSVIIGAKRMDQLDDDLGAAGLQLTPDQIALLDATTQPPTLYPEWMIARQNAGR